MLPLARLAIVQHKAVPVLAVVGNGAIERRSVLSTKLGASIISARKILDRLINETPGSVSSGNTNDRVTVLVEVQPEL
jgi:hypothetical protein